MSYISEQFLALGFYEYSDAWNLNLNRQKINYLSNNLFYQEKFGKYFWIQ